MKIFINSYNRPDAISTPALLDASGISYTVLLHNQEELERYRAAGRLGNANVIVSSQPVGMVNIRDWVLANLVAPGEWYLHLDDNITGFQIVPEPYYSVAKLQTKVSPATFKPIFETPATSERFLEVCEESIQMAENTGAKLVGFASNVNFYFREKKWREVGYIIGKTQLIKKTDLRYDRGVFATDDYLWTAQNLEQFGKVLINNYAVAIKKHYAKGGIGPYEERLQWKLNDVEYIMKRWPGLYRYKVKSGCHPKAEIQLRFNDTDQVNVWRKLLYEHRLQAKDEKELDVLV